MRINTSHLLCPSFRHIPQIAFHLFRVISHARQQLHVVFHLTVVFLAGLSEFEIYHHHPSVFHHHAVRASGPQFPVFLPDDVTFVEQPPCPVVPFLHLWQLESLFRQFPDFVFRFLPSYYAFEHQPADGILDVRFRPYGREQRVQQSSAVDEALFRLLFVHARYEVCRTIGLPELYFVFQAFHGYRPFRCFLCQPVSSLFFFFFFRGTQGSPFIPSVLFVPCAVSSFGQAG